jgi:hypothetical protein
VPQQWTNSASLVFLTPAISGENHLVPLWSTLVLPSNYITHSIEIDLTTSFDYRTTNFDDTSHISLKWNFHPRVRKKMWKIKIISGLINYIDFSPFFYFFPLFSAGNHILSQQVMCHQIIGFTLVNKHC